jgi:hypothetical protein
MTYLHVKLGDMTQQAPVARAASRVSGDTRTPIRRSPMHSATGHHDPDAIAVRPSPRLRQPATEDVEGVPVSRNRSGIRTQEGTFCIQVTDWLCP